MLLGSMYVSGQGVARDDVTAYMWFSLAAQANNEARATLDILETQMTAGQVAAAQRMARDFKPVRRQLP